MHRFLLLLIPLLLFGCGDSSAFQAPISVPNGTGAQVRSNMNNALQAVATEQSGASAPATTYAYQKWIDTSTTPPTERIRNAANTDWVTVGTVSATAYTATSAGNATTLQNLYPSSSASAYVIPVTDSNGRLAWGMKPSFRGALVYQSFSVGTYSSGDSVIPFYAEMYDTDAIHDTSVNPSRMTVPAGVSKIRLYGQANLATSGAGTSCFLKISINGTSMVGRPMALSPLVDSATVFNISSPVIGVSPGDYLEMRFGPTSCGITAYGVNGGDTTWFAMEIIE